MVYLPMKRSRELDLDEAITNMANCLMLLSRAPTSTDSYHNAPGRVFECKTCNRQFASFQALGGHRASHKKPRLNNMHNDTTRGTNELGVPAKAKSHECSVCGLEFSIGQALGGHMRRHRAAAMNENLSSGSDDSFGNVMEKVNGRRVFGLDLNLTPVENEFQLQKSYLEFDKRLFLELEFMSLESIMTHDRSLRNTESYA